MTRRIVSRDAWLEARMKHLEDEKAFTRARDALSARRRALPWLRVEKDYVFQSAQGPRTLHDLFAGKSQLIVMHFMFGPDWDEGCPSCSFWADGYSGLEVHLAHRDTSLVAVSNTGVEKIERYRDRMGWTFDWVSSLGSEFNADHHVTFDPSDVAAGSVFYNYRSGGFPSTEAPGLSIFHRPDPETIVHTYSTYSRGLDMMNAAYHLMDLLPKGRDEAAGTFPMSWLRRKDQYEFQSSTAT
ncbi:MAG: thioredoxin family protein [Pseudomonadota bacterium]